MAGVAEDLTQPQTLPMIPSFQDNKETAWESASQWLLCVRARMDSQFTLMPSDMPVPHLHEPLLGEDAKKFNSPVRPKTTSQSYSPNLAPRPGPT